MSQKSNLKSVIDKRRELVFLYSVRESNPNGDPDDENRPRTDDEGYALVSDVRIKRTIRDYWLSNGEKVLVRREYDAEGGIYDMDQLINEALKDQNKIDRNIIMEKIPQICLDARIFGFVGTVKDANCSLTGPVQFGIGKSLNKPTVTTHAITSVISAAKKTGGAMGTFHILDYALFRVEGVVCPKLAEISKMTNEDLLKLYTGLWKGTQTINTRSKFNHVPKLLLSFRSKDAEFLIGELAYRLDIEENENKNEDPILIFDKLIEKVEKIGKKYIEAVEYLEYIGFKMKYKDNIYDSFEKLWKNTPLKDIPLEKIQL